MELETNEPPVSLSNEPVNEPKMFNQNEKQEVEQSLKDICDSEESRPTGKDDSTCSSIE